MARADCFGTFERPRRVSLARRRCRIEKGRDWIGQRADVACDRQRLDVLRELRPTVEAMLTREDELRVGKRDRLRLRTGRADATRALAHATDGIIVARLAGVDQFLRLLLVLLEVRTGRQVASRHTNLLSQRLESAQSG